MAEEQRENVTGTASLTVDESNTAKTMKSGSLDVLATPAVAALMEEASCNAIRDFLPEGITTVGILLNLRHTSATPLRMKVFAESRLVSHEGRKYTFEIRAYDEAGEIAEAYHERFEVKKESFMNKANAKKEESR